MKNAKDKFKEELENATNELNKSSTVKAEETAARLTDMMRKADEEFKSMRSYTNDISNRILDRSTATIYTRLCNDFRVMQEILSPELYDMMRNAFCEFSAMSFDAAKNNYETIFLPVRINGDKVEYDKELYVFSIYNAVFIRSLRGDKADQEFLWRIKSEINDLLEDPEQAQDNGIAKNHGQKKKHVFTEGQRNILEMADEALRIILPDFLRPEQAQTYGPDKDNISPNM